MIVDIDIINIHREILFNIWFLGGILFLSGLNILAFVNKITQRKSCYMTAIYFVSQSFILPAVLFPVSAIPAIPFFLAFPLEGCIIAVSLSLNKCKNKRLIDDENHGITAIYEKYKRMQASIWEAMTDEEKQLWLDEYKNSSSKPIKPVYLLLIAIVSFFAGGAFMLIAKV
jgi:hypothetical protein